MSGCKHPLTNFALLLLLFLVYCVYPIPFINTGNNFQLSKDFLIIETCGGVAMMLTSIVGNMLCIVTFTETQNRARFVYILMFLADAMQPFLTLPARLSANWEYFYEDLEDRKNTKCLQHDKMHESDPLTLRGSSKEVLIAWHSVWHGIVVVSLLFFTLTCVLDFYVSLKQIKEHSIPSQIKFATLFMVAIIAILLAYLYYYIHTSGKWNKGVALSVLSYLIPITVCTLCLLLTHVIHACFTISLNNDEVVRKPSIRFIWMLWISYIVCYTPFYTYVWQGRLLKPEIIHITHGMTLMKPCCNIFTLIEFDRTAKQRLKQTLLKAYTSTTGCLYNTCCCCCPRVAGFCMGARDRFRAMLDANKRHLVVVETERGGLIIHQNGCGNLLTNRSVMSAV